MNRRAFHAAVRRLAAALSGLALLTAAAGSAAALAPAVGEVFWQPADAHCAFRRAGSMAPSGGDPATWRYIFVTELVSDDLASVERGYMRLDGLLRELEFIGRRDAGERELRTYRTFGEDPVEIRITMQAGDSRKSELGQTVLVHFDGTVAVVRGTSERQLPFVGTCGVEPAAGEDRS
jgi:hypothetical protein